MVSVLLLDVMRAYDNMVHQCLLDNLRKLQLGWLVPWIDLFLTRRSTRIRMPEGISDRISMSTEIPQGSPLFLILYLLYNACLVAACSEGDTTVFR